jgi:hypothetical protein
MPTCAIGKQGMRLLEGRMKAMTWHERSILIYSILVVFFLLALTFVPA